MQLRVRHIIRNILSSWVATGANMAVGFFLSPFIVHRLGSAAYGVWVLSISSVNYLGLLDLGMRSSVLRFVSRERTIGNHAGASEALSAALWVRLQISGAVLLLAGLLAWLFPILFKIPPDLARSSQIAVMLIGITTTTGMCLGVFGGVLSALNRYDLQTGVSLTQLAMRVGGVVLVLSRGGGLVGIASAELAASLVANLLLFFTALKTYPELHIRLTRPSREILRSLWSYSLYVFLQTVAIQLVYQTDNLVVGSFVSATAVTFYAIGNSLCRYTDQFAASMGMTFVPAASTYDAAGDRDKVRSLYRNGARTMLAVSLPILVTLLFRGRTFIRLWMGPQYAHSSGTVLIFLAIALIFSLANNTAGAIAMGTDRHKFVAKWALAEGVANLLLSVVLVHFLGIYGVALGTMIPSLFVHLFVWPSYISRMLGINRLEIYGKVWGVMLAAALPFALASALVDRMLAVQSISGFFLQTFLLLPVFAFVLLILFREAFQSRILPVVRSRLYGRKALAA